MTRKNPKILWSPHILGRSNACANNVYRALLCFSRATGTRLAVEGDSTSLLLQVEHAAHSCMPVRPLYRSAEGDSISPLLPALLSSGRPVWWSAPLRLRFAGVGQSNAPPLSACPCVNSLMPRPCREGWGLGTRLLCRPPNQRRSDTVKKPVITN